MKRIFVSLLCTTTLAGGSGACSQLSRYSTNIPGWTTVTYRDGHSVPITTPTDAKQLALDDFVHRICKDYDGAVVITFPNARERHLCPAHTAE